MKQRRDIGRIIAKVSIFLLLGAIVNIAVAWAVQWYWKDLDWLAAFDKRRGTVGGHLKGWHG